MGAMRSKRLTSCWIWRDGRSRACTRLLPCCCSASGCDAGATVDGKRPGHYFDGCRTWMRRGGVLAGIGCVPRAVRLHRQVCGRTAVCSSVADVERIIRSLQIKVTERVSGLVAAAMPTSGRVEIGVGSGGEVVHGVAGLKLGDSHRDRRLSRQ